jgi:hypothetical protein
MGAVGGCLDGGGDPPQARRDDRGVALVVAGARRLSRAVSGDGPAQRPGAAGPDLRPHWRGGGGAHHLPSRGDRWDAELGLPVLLGPRREPDPGGPVGGGLPGRGPGVLRLLCDGRRRAGRRRAGVAGPVRCGR